MDCERESSFLGKREGGEFQKKKRERRFGGGTTSVMTVSIECRLKGRVALGVLSFMMDLLRERSAWVRNYNVSDMEAESHNSSVNLPFLKVN